MAKLTTLDIRIPVTLDENGAIVSLAAGAKYRHSDDTDPAYVKAGAVDLTDTLSPGSKTLAAWRDDVLAAVNAEA